jgi:hypothetical protein
MLNEASKEHEAQFWIEEQSTIQVLDVVRVEFITQEVHIVADEQLEHKLGHLKQVLLFELVVQ